MVFLAVNCNLIACKFLVPYPGLVLRRARMSYKQLLLGVARSHSRSRYSYNYRSTQVKNSRNKNVQYNAFEQCCPAPTLLCYSYKLLASKSVCQSMGREDMKQYNK
jgi:hypothetical protein